MMEELLYLADGDQAVLDMGYGEYLEAFFTWFPIEGAAYANSALNTREREALLGLLPLVQKMYSEAPDGVGEAALIATGWPKRIAPIAESTLEVFRARGRFSEDLEEVEPAVPGWCASRAEFY
jgi:hypothetical protein